MSAHYDSRGSFGSLRHPGGDDDGLCSWSIAHRLAENRLLIGSGTTAILAIARAISRKRIQFKSHVELVVFVCLLSISLSGDLNLYP